MEIEIPNIVKIKNGKIWFELTEKQLDLYVHTIEDENSFEQTKVNYIKVPLDINEAKKIFKQIGIFINKVEPQIDHSLVINRNPLLIKENKDVAEK